MLIIVHHIMHADVKRLYGLLDCGIYTCMAHHIAIGEVYYDEVILLGVDSGHKFLSHLGSRHLRLEVVSSHFWRSHEYSVLTLEWLLASAIEEERHMGILLRLSYMKLLLTLFGKVLSESHGHIPLREENMYMLFERIVIRGHAIELQAGDRLHAILLLESEHMGELFGTVVAIVEENHYVALADTTVHSIIHDRFDKLVGHTLCV